MSSTGRRKIRTASSLFRGNSELRLTLRREPTDVRRDQPRCSRLRSSVTDPGPDLLRPLRARTRIASRERWRFSARVRAKSVPLRWPAHALSRRRLRNHPVECGPFLLRWRQGAIRIGRGSGSGSKTSSGRTTSHSSQRQRSRYWGFESARLQETIAATLQSGSACRLAVEPLGERPTS